MFIKICIIRTLYYKMNYKNGKNLLYYKMKNEKVYKIKKFIVISQGDEFIGFLNFFNSLWF